MGLDGGYIGSLDHAISNLHVGRQQGRQQGLAEGYEQGFEEGHRDGWDKAIELANERIRKDQARFQQQFAEKERLKLELQELQQAHQNLEAKYREESRQYTELVWHYNRCIVFMGAVRRVVEDLISKETPQAERARELFAEKYGELVDDALKKGRLKTPPEKETEFAKELPMAHKLIVEILHSVGQKNELPSGTPEP